MSNSAVERPGVQLSRAALERMAAHAEASYPQECFGFLLGHFGDESIPMIYPGRNVAVSRPHDHYEMDPQEFLQAQTDAEQWGGEVIGFYHSHPDAAACPSAYDRERAWEEYLYLIIPVIGGRAGRARLWQLATADEPFWELELQIVEAGAETYVRPSSCPGPAAQ